MEHGILLVWYVLVAGSLIFAIYDSITNTPVSWVQKLAWILVIFYTGPVGLFLYLLACRSPDLECTTLSHQRIGSRP